MDALSHQFLDSEHGLSIKDLLQYYVQTTTTTTLQLDKHHGKSCDIKEVIQSDDLKGSSSLSVNEIVRTNVEQKTQIVSKSSFGFYTTCKQGRNKVMKCAVMKILKYGSMSPHPQRNRADCKGCQTQGSGCRRCRSGSRVVIAEASTDPGSGPRSGSSSNEVVTRSARNEHGLRGATTDVGDRRNGRLAAQRERPGRMRGPGVDYER